jgi:hypothetical protein
MTKWTIGDRRIGSEAICFQITLASKGALVHNSCSSTGLKASMPLRFSLLELVTTLARTWLSFETTHNVSTDPNLRLESVCEKGKQENSFCEVLSRSPKVRNQTFDPSQLLLLGCLKASRFNLLRIGDMQVSCTTR